MASNLKDSKSKRESKEEGAVSFFSIDDLSTIMEMLKENEVTEFKLERGEEKLSLKRGAQIAASSQVPVMMSPAPMIMSAPAPAPVAAAEASVARAETQLQVIPGQKAQSNLHEVKSPMVGTFYRRSSPDSEPFVSIGSLVKKGDKLCLVEAMKLFNDVSADISGRITEVCLDDGQMVEFGEVMFRIEPA